LPRFTLVGDVLAAEVEIWVRFISGVAPKLEFVPQNLVEGETALCDFLEGQPGLVPTEQRLGKLVAAATKRPLHAIALQFWGWAKSPCMAGLEPGSEPYHARLLADVSAAVEEIERAAREAQVARPRLFWLLQGPDRDQPERASRLNDLYRLIARYHGDRASDTGYPLSRAADSRGDPENRDAWSDFLPCSQVERQSIPELCTQPNVLGGLAQIHPTTNSVRLCIRPELTLHECAGSSPGTFRVAEVMVGDIKRFFGLLSLTP
jgi:hypothetical protein